MAQWWHGRPVQLAGLALGASLLAFGLVGCQVLSTTVTSVTGTYEPYNPALGNQGIPAEQVDFTVSGYTAGDIVCVIEVFDNSGVEVGSTVATIHPATSGGGTVNESVPVDITGNIFEGIPSNAVMSCGTSG